MLQFGVVALLPTASCTRRSPDGSRDAGELAVGCTTTPVDFSEDPELKHFRAGAEMSWRGHRTQK